MAVKCTAKKTNLKQHHLYWVQEADESPHHQIRELSNYRDDLEFNCASPVSFYLQLKHAICTRN